MFGCFDHGVDLTLPKAMPPCQLSDSISPRHRAVFCHTTKFNAQVWRLPACLLLALSGTLQGRTHENRKLSLRGKFFICNEFSDRTSVPGLVDLREFVGDYDLTVAQCLGYRRERTFQPMRRLEHHKNAWNVAPFCQPARTLTSPGRWKSDERRRFRWKACAGERRR